MKEFLRRIGLLYLGRIIGPGIQASSYRKADGVFSMV
jgi:hypothetical protein